MSMRRTFLITLKIEVAGQWGSDILKAVWQWGGRRVRFWVWWIVELDIVFMENMTKREDSDNENRGPRTEPWGTPEEWGLPQKECFELDEATTSRERLFKSIKGCAMKRSLVIKRCLGAVELSGNQIKQFIMLLVKWLWTWEATIFSRISEMKVRWDMGQRLLKLLGSALEQI